MENHRTEMITGGQIRSARIMVGWTAHDLAHMSGLSYPTIQRAETTPGIPMMKAPNLLAIQRALETAGIVFLADGESRDGGPGIRLRR